MNEHLKRMNRSFQEWEQIIELIIPEKETRVNETGYSIYKKTWSNSRKLLLKDREQLQCLREQQRQDAVIIFQGLISLIEKTEEGFDETEKKCDRLLKRLDEKFNKLQLQHDTHLEQVQWNNKTYGQRVETSDNSNCADEPNNRELRDAACSEKISFPSSNENLRQAEMTFEVDFKQLDDKFNKWKLDNTIDFDKAHKHVEPIKQQYFADEQDPLIPKMTQPTPFKLKEGRPRLPPSGIMNITSPNSFTPPTTGFSAAGVNCTYVMEDHMQYYNQSNQQDSPLSIKIQPPPSAKKDKSPLPVSESENSCEYDTASSVSVCPSDENRSAVEKRFDDEFMAWDNEFRKWKLRNAHHPNKEWYEIYKAKWTGWRDQLIEKREKMRRKHEVLKLWNESRKT